MNLSEVDPEDLDLPEVLDTALNIVLQSMRYATLHNYLETHLPSNAEFLIEMIYISGYAEQSNKLKYVPLTPFHHTFICPDIQNTLTQAYLQSIINNQLNEVSTEEYLIVKPTADLPFNPPNNMPDPFPDSLIAYDIGSILILSRHCDDGNILKKHALNSNTTGYRTEGSIQSLGEGILKDFCL